MANKYPDNEWMQEKLGKFSSSKISPLFTNPKNTTEKLSVGAKTYVKKVLSEILTGTYRELPEYKSLAWGKEHEPVCAELLSKQYEGFKYFGKEDPKFFHLTEFSGGSPDATCQFPGKIVFEIKCPEDPVNHQDFLLCEFGNDLKKLEQDYWYQLQMNMAVMAKEFGCKVSEMKGVFASYCPLMRDEDLKLKTIDVYPDEEFHKELPIRIENAEDELRRRYQLIKALKQQKIAA